MISAIILRAIVDSNQDDFKSLAAAAGGDPTTFYRGANFNDTDLRGEDLRGFNLTAATFKRVRVDRNTKADEEFSEQVGLKRTLTVQMPIGDVLQMILNKSGIQIQRPTHSHYGDLVEDAIFGPTGMMYINNRNRLALPFEKRAFQFLVSATQTVRPSGPSRGKKLDMEFRSNMDIIKHAFSIGSDRVVADAFSVYYRATTSKRAPSVTRRQASLTKRTAAAVVKIAEQERMAPSELCCALLIAYASALRSMRESEKVSAANITRMLRGER